MVPFAVLSMDCFPDPRSEYTPGTHDGTSLSRRGPICLHIRSKWSGAICLLATTCHGNQKQNNHLLQSTPTVKQAGLMSKIKLFLFKLEYTEYIYTAK